VNGCAATRPFDQRIEYDLYYIKNWSMGFDVKILFLTLLVFETRARTRRPPPRADECRGARANARDHARRGSRRAATLNRPATQAATKPSTA